MENLSKNNMYSTNVKLDKFYTKPNLVIECLNHLDLNKFNYIVEPSAGEGAFLNPLKKLVGDNVIGYDLSPEADGIIKQDYLKLDEEYKPNTLVVGNPPFGIRCKLAKDFVRHSIKLKAQTIAFILPDVFNKPTYYSLIKNTNYKLIKIVKLPDAGFTIDGDSYHVPCSLFIWELNSDKKCIAWKPNTYTTLDFEFVKPKDLNTKSHIVMKQAVSKKMIINVKEPKSGLHYINPLTLSKSDLIKRLNKINWTGFSATNGGVKALGQEEVIKQYNLIYG